MRDRLRIEDHMVDDKGEGERGDGEIEPLQSQRRHADDEADQRRARRRPRADSTHTGHVIVGEQDRVGIGADREKTGLPERNQPGLSGQQIERDGADHGDQRADHQGQRVGADEERRRRASATRSAQRPAPDDVAVAERDPLPGRSLKWPVRISDPLDFAAAEQAVGPHHQHDDDDDEAGDFAQAFADIALRQALDQRR